MKEGDLLFVFGNSWVSRLIKIVSAGRMHNLENVPSHVAIVWVTLEDDTLLIEANFKGVQITPIKKYKKCKTRLARMKEPRDIKKGLQWAFQQENTNYDFLQLGGILLRSFWRLFGNKLYQKSKKIRNFLDSKTRFICSEFVENYASLTGSRLWKGDFGFVTPHDLYRSDFLNFVE